MATYSCRLYQNTGFNAVNIPDGPALLETVALQKGYFDVSAVEIMQNRFLSKIRVRATWNQVKECDYVRVGTTSPDYYFISSIEMLATDVAELSVLYDYVTSAGGVANLQILDGVTSRVHVTDDSFGKYCEVDPLTAPAQPLQIDMNWFNPETESGLSHGSHTYVEATVDIPQTGAALEGTAYLIKDEEKVIIPTVRPLTKFTQYSLETGQSATVNPHTMLYDLDDTTASDYGNGWGNQKALLMGMKRVRELGIEQGAIINQVQIPLAYAAATQDGVSTENVSVDSQFIDEEGHTVYHSQRVVDRSITKFRGKTNTKQSNIQYQYSGAMNNKVNYTEYTKYGLIACSGESCEYNAEDIVELGGATSPSLMFVGDPHTDGKPYFRWRRVNGDTSYIGFFKNCITGLQWKQVPLFFRDPSGSAINTLKYQNSRITADTSYQQRLEDRIFNAKMGVVTGSLQTGINAFSQAGPAMGILGLGTGAITGGIQSMGLVRDQMDDELAYTNAKRSEMSDYIVNNSVAAPTINFPYNSEMMRDFYGNGCLMYRYKYSNADINRIDKLLSMYGYKYTKALETSDFNNRQKFNYVECANVTVTGLPKYMCDGISMMLRNGVRVWHIVPNPGAYTEPNPNA